MDVAAAFPSVARGCLLKKDKEGRDRRVLVRWTDSLMRDRRVIMNVNGQDGQRHDRLAPRIANIICFVRDLHCGHPRHARGAAEDSRGISYVDDVTWVVEGTDVDDIFEKLERCAAASLEGAGDNAVRFEESKTEAFLFSKRRRHKQCRWEIRVGASHRVRVNLESTQWLGICLDASLNLAENRRRRMGKTRRRPGYAASSVNTGFPRRHHATSRW